MDEQTLRRIIREELDNYDRDKGITPRMSKSGVPAGYKPHTSDQQSVGLFGKFVHSIDERPEPVRSEPEEGR